METGPRRNYASMLRPNRRLMTAFGSRPLRLIDRAEVRAWWDGVHRELSPRNANAHLIVFRAMVLKTGPIDRTNSAP